MQNLLGAIEKQLRKATTVIVMSDCPYVRTTQSDYHQKDFS